VSARAAPATEALAFESLGGTCELFAVEPAEPLAATAAWVRGLHGRLTRFEPTSELSLFNAHAGEWVEVSPVLHDLLAAALRASAESDGLVDIAVLPALIAAGYDRTFELIPHGELEERVGRPVPPLDSVLSLRGRSARLREGAAVDLGGLAKGWIADRAVERLGANALVSCAGDLYARGGGESGEGWPVGFGDRTVLLVDTGAATSGTTRRRWGEGLHHLIDPRTGLPSASDLEEVSVLAPTALDAEVLAKTALLLGSAAAPAFLGPRASGWSLR
jgi:FAD:protein FMN transferase